MKDVWLLVTKELKYVVAMTGAVLGLYWQILDAYQFGGAVGLILYGRNKEIEHGQRGDDNPSRARAVDAPSAASSPTDPKLAKGRRAT